MGRAPDSHKDDTRGEKKNEERPAKRLSALSTDKSGVGGARDKAANLTTVFCLFSMLPKA